MGMAVVWLDVTEPEALDLARNGLALVDRAMSWAPRQDAFLRAPAKNAGELASAHAESLRNTPHARARLAAEFRTTLKLGRSARDDFEGAYTEVADYAVRSWAGDTIPPDALVGMAVLASDGFSGTTGASADGRTMDAAGGGSADTWAASSGTWEIDGNSLKVASGGAFQIIYDSTMPELADQTIGVTKGTGRATGPMARVSGAGNNYGYAGWENAGDILRLNPGYAYLASGAHDPWATSDLQVIVVAGTSISMYRGASLTAGPVTDSTIATGRAGIMSGNTSQTTDNWYLDGVSAGGQPYDRRTAGTPHMRRDHGLFVPRRW